MDEVLAIILGGGRGTRLFPLTHMRSKPAVPIGGKYRLIDVPVSNCLHAGIRRIYVLTQFNSASLNRHIAQAYRMDHFSRGFVEILAAEQTPDNANWYQGTADAVRKASRHFADYDADYYLILSGDHLYRMDYGELVETHVDRGSDITIAAKPVAREDASGMGILRFDTSGRIVAFEEKPPPERLHEIRSSVPEGSNMPGVESEKPFVASMGIYVFTRDILLDLLRGHSGVDFGHEIIPSSLHTHKVTPYLFRGYWADVGTISSFYNANLALTEYDAPFSFYDPLRPIFTRPLFLPDSRVDDCRIDRTLFAEGCYMESAEVEQSIVGIRMQIQRGARVTRSVLLGTDFYERGEELPPAAGVPELGVGAGSVLDRVIMDKNARIGRGVRLVNEKRVEHADGDGYHIREGIIIVPKDGVIRDGTVV
ncbi:MAG: glucose-1-phosphate adenylyltransferase [Acidobacteria bacterium]|nr:MAG: glucose-1-phosphate adenylyltransferase [Acidobacteriota bacterium]